MGVVGGVEGIDDVSEHHCLVAILSIELQYRLYVYIIMMMMMMIMMMLMMMIMMIVMLPGTVLSSHPSQRYRSSTRSQETVDGYNYPA